MCTFFGGRASSGHPVPLGRCTQTIRSQSERFMATVCVSVSKRIMPKYNIALFFDSKRFINFPFLDNTNAQRTVLDPGFRRVSE